MNIMRKLRKRIGESIEKNAEFMQTHKELFMPHSRMMDDSLRKEK